MIIADFLSNEKSYPFGKHLPQKCPLADISRYGTMNLPGKPIQVKENCPMDFMELAKKRCSVRAYTDRKVEPDKLEKILEAARIAPTGEAAGGAE